MMNIQALICDDIRHEINGQTSYIGAYKASREFAEPPPWSIGRLGVVIFLSSAGEHVPDSYLVEVRAPNGDSIFTETIHPPREAGENPTASVTQEVGLLFENLEFTAPGNLTVKISVEDVVLYKRALVLAYREEPMESE